MNVYDERVARRVLADELTTLPNKATLYAQEAACREALGALHAADGHAAFAMLRDTGVAVLRPDAIVERKAAAVAEYWERLGVEPVACFTTTMSPLDVREIWRYQLNVATGLRLALLDCLFRTSEVVVVMLRNGPTAVDLPPSVVLAESKGASTPRSRADWELRSFLRSPARLRSYVHTSDEPADVLRDLAILAGPRAVPDLLRSDTRLDVAEVLAACDDALSRRVLGRSLPGLPAGDASDERALWALLDAGYDPWELFDRHCDAASTAYHDATVINDGGGDGWWAVSRSKRSDLVRMARTATGDLSSLAPRLT